MQRLGTTVAFHDERPRWSPVRTSSPLLVVLSVLLGALPAESHAENGDSLCLVILDPLAAELSCPCVAGYAQRDYRELAKHLEVTTGKPVTIGFGGSLRAALKHAGSQRYDVAIGKFSVIVADAAELGMAADPLCGLADKEGSTDVRGLLVVAADDPAETIADLFDYTVLIGPPEHAEKHGLALEALRSSGLPEPFTTVPCASCSDAASTLLEAPSDVPHVAIVSAYAEPLLEGCGTVPAGAIRVVGTTEPAPFIAACVPATMEYSLRDALRRALLSVAEQPELCRKLESRGGFVDWDLLQRGWPGWRGLRRDGFVPDLPEKAPDTVRVNWRQTLVRSGLGGVAAVGRRVVIGDRNDADTHDVFRCFDIDTGETLWEHEYDARGELDYGNSPRATPLIRDGRVYTLGALGHLHCLALADGQVLWKKHLVDDYGVPQTALSAWGYCSSPLLTAGRLIVNPGAPHASLVALNPVTGDEVWRCPGLPAGYASFVVVHPRSGPQLIGYDRESLGGWDLAAGTRLWSLVPPSDGDFCVPTPVLLAGHEGPLKVAVSSETNGTAMIGIKDDGMAAWEEGFRSDELACEMCTPVSVAGWLCGVQDRFVALDSSARLQRTYANDDASFATYAAVLSGPSSVMTVGNDGRLTWYRLHDGEWSRAGQLSLLDEPYSAAPLYSHPAFVDGRMLIRTDNELLCVSLSVNEEAPTEDEE